MTMNPLFSSIHPIILHKFWKSEQKPIQLIISFIVLLHDSTFDIVFQSIALCVT